MCGVLITSEEENASSEGRGNNASIVSLEGLN